MAPPRTQERPAAVRHVLALGAYLLASLALTWPLARHFATHVPGDGTDDPALVWNLWWLKHQLLEQGTLDVFHAGWMFHPVGVNLAFYTLTPLNGLLAIPLQSAANLIVASNLILLSSFVLGAYGAYLLVTDLLRGELARAGARDGGVAVAAFLAGLLYSFASAKLFYVSLGQFNIASSQWIPFCMLYVWRLGRSHTPAAGVRNGLLAGLFLVFQAWAELTYASFLLIFILLFALWWGWEHLLIPGKAAKAAGRRADIKAFAGGMVALGGVFLIGISPFLWAMLPDLRNEGDFFGSGGGFADVFSADLMGYLVPTRLHPLLGAWVATLPFANDKGQQIFLGYLVVGAAVAGAVVLVRSPQRSVRRAGWFWLLCALGFWLLTLGPHLRWAGQDTAIPGPFALVSRLPFFSGNRYPSRYSVMLLACVAVLAGAGIDWLLGACARRGVNLTRPATAGWVAVGLAGLLLAEHLSAPLPLSDFRIPAIYGRLAEEPDDFAVLELPTGWRNGARVLGKADVLIMMQEWYQTAHGKRRLGGNTSRNPAHKFQYFTEAPLIGDLIALMNADQPHIAAAVGPELDSLLARDRELAPAVLDFLGVRYVLVYVEQSPPALLRMVEEALPLTLVEEWRGPDWRGAASTIRLYAVDTQPNGESWRANLAAPTGKLYLGPGWSGLDNPTGRVRYATRPQPELLLNLPESGGQLRVQVFGPADQVRLALNGHTLGSTVVNPTGDWVEAVIPPGVANQPVDSLTLTFSGPTVPLTATVTAPALGWPVGETGTTLAPEATLAAMSAGEEVGDFAGLLVNGEDVAPNTRGYNLAALDRSGQVLDAVAFDTHADPAASSAMAAWLASWPAGTILAGAIADEASMNLNAGAVAALQAAGVTFDAREHFRWSHAFIGAAGAPPGSAQEVYGLLGPARTFVGPPIDGPRVAGGAGEIEFTPSSPPASD